MIEKLERRYVMQLKKRIIIWLIMVLILSGLPIGAVAANQGIQSYNQVKIRHPD